MQVGQGLFERDDRRRSDFLRQRHVPQGAAEHEAAWHGPGHASETSGQPLANKAPPAGQDGQASSLLDCLGSHVPLYGLIYVLIRTELAAILGQRQDYCPSGGNAA